MHPKQAQAPEVAVAYHSAWTRGQMDSAASYLAPDVVCHAPAGTLNGREAVRALMEPFAAMLTASELLAVYGDDHRALLMYLTASCTVPNAPGAELYRIEDQHIVEIRIIFDRLSFALARGDVVGV